MSAGKDLGLWLSEGSIYVDEQVALNEDASAALRDLEQALAGSAEVQGFESNVMVDLPPVNISGAPIDIGPVNINPMVMIGMMMMVGEFEPL